MEQMKDVGRGLRPHLIRLDLRENGETRSYRFGVLLSSERRKYLLSLLRAGRSF
jgi:hypothetical protein